MNRAKIGWPSRSCRLSNPEDETRAWEGAGTTVKRSLMSPELRRQDAYGNSH